MSEQWRVGQAEVLPLIREDELVGFVFTRELAADVAKALNGGSFTEQGLRREWSAAFRWVARNGTNRGYLSPNAARDISRLADHVEDQEMTPWSDE